MNTPPGIEVVPLLTPAEVASLFRVDPKTVTRWASAGKLRFIKTPGPNGHRRYFEADVRALLTPESAESEAPLLKVVES